MRRRLTTAVLAMVLFASACGSEPTFPDELAAQAFTTTHPCGDGFHAGSGDQTLHLEIFWHTGPFPFGEDFDRSQQSVDLPSRNWAGRIFVGEDLFDNWCNDVGGSKRRVDFTVEVVGGHLEVTEVPGSEDAPAAATLTGVAVRAPDGSSVAVGDLDLVNEAFGLFAG